MRGRTTGILLVASSVGLGSAAVALAAPLLLDPPRRSEAPVAEVDPGAELTLRRPADEAPKRILCRGPLRASAGGLNLLVEVAPGATKAGLEGEHLLPGTCAFRDEPFAAYEKYHDAGGLDFRPRDLENPNARFVEQGIRATVLSCVHDDCVLEISLGQTAPVGPYGIAIKTQELQRVKRLHTPPPTPVP